MGPVLDFTRGTPKIGHQPKFHPEVPLEYLGQDNGGSQDSRRTSSEDEYSFKEGYRE